MSRRTRCPVCSTMVDVEEFTAPVSNGRVGVRFTLPDGTVHGCIPRGGWPDGWCQIHGTWACGLIHGRCDQGARSAALAAPGA